MSTLEQTRQKLIADILAMTQPKRAGEFTVFVTQKACYQAGLLRQAWTYEEARCLYMNRLITLRSHGEWELTPPALVHLFRKYPRAVEAALKSLTKLL